MIAMPLPFDWTLNPSALPWTDATPSVIAGRPAGAALATSRRICVRFAISSVSICAAFFSGEDAAAGTTITALRRSIAAMASEVQNPNVAIAFRNGIP